MRRPIVGRRSIVGRRPIFGRKPIVGRRTIVGCRPIVGRRPIVGSIFSSSVPYSLYPPFYISLAVHHNNLHKFRHTSRLITSHSCNKWVFEHKFHDVMLKATYTKRQK